MSDGIADYVSRVYRFALRLTGDPHRAEDLTQETFLRAWRKRSSLRDPRATRTWLFRIAVNLWRDGLRNRRDGDTEWLETEIPCTNLAPEQPLESREELRRVLDMLDNLPPRQREVLHLVAVEELSLAEVAEVLQINPGTAKVHLSLARKQMREKFQAES